MFSFCVSFPLRYLESLVVGRWLWICSYDSIRYLLLWNTCIEYGVQSTSKRQNQGLPPGCLPSSIATNNWPRWTPRTDRGSFYLPRKFGPLSVWLVLGHNVGKERLTCNSGLWSTTQLELFQKSNSRLEKDGWSPAFLLSSHGQGSSGERVFFIIIIIICFGRYIQST